MGYQQRLAVGRDAGDRLRADANPHLLGSKRQLECHHALINDHRHRGSCHPAKSRTPHRVPAGHRSQKSPLPRIQFANPARGRATGHVQPCTVGLNEVLRDLPVTRTGVGSRGGPIEVEHRTRSGASDEEPLPSGVATIAVGTATVSLALAVPPPPLKPSRPEQKTRRNLAAKSTRHGFPVVSRDAGTRIARALRWSKLIFIRSMI